MRVVRREAARRGPLQRWTAGEIGLRRLRIVAVLVAGYVTTLLVARGCWSTHTIRVGGDESTIGAVVLVDGVVVDTIKSWGKAAVGPGPLEGFGEARLKVAVGPRQMTFISTIGETLRCETFDGAWVSFSQRKALAVSD